MRNVMIATPCLDGRMDYLYTYSLFKSTLECAINGIALYPVFVAKDALIQRARNDLMYYAYGMDITDMVFIDDDQFWEPDDLIKLLQHEVDFVGGTCRKKSTEVENYPVKVYTGKESPGMVKEFDAETGLMEVAGIGTGFLRLSKKAINLLYECKEIPVYKENGTEKKFIFNVGIDENTQDLVSEDTCMCNLYKNLGGSIYLDTRITVGHVGSVNFQGSFQDWALKNNLIKEKELKGESDAASLALCKK